MVVIRVLNVAEKPSVARAVAEILSRRGGSSSSSSSMRTRDGHSVYNKIFEFEYNVGAQACFMSVTSVTGHLMELDFEERYKKWHSCDPADLYHAPVRKFVPQDKLPLKRTLEEESRRCQWLVLWLDCDREGENIAFEVVDICRSTNPRLTIWRARFSALIDREIHQAAQNLVKPNPLFSDAVDARQEIDLRIGASFTRFQTMLLTDSFVFPFQENDKRLVLSYGPCQFPTLGFVVERYWEIQAHQPEDFWSISCQYSCEDGSATFNWARGRLFDHLSAVIIYEMCMEEPTATVIEVKGRECKKFPPHPLNTVELQKRASRYFRMSSEQTMKVAEELYQAGFISYPRTETDYFSENTDLQSIVHGQSEHSVWGWYAQRLLDPTTNLWRQPSNGGHDDKAHPPIHPTKFTQGESHWSNDHMRLYELVTRHFLACVSQPAVGYGTTASIDIAGECFSASGLMITAKNYLEVYRFESWGSSTIPKFEVGQQFVPTRLTLDIGKTSPPPLLSEADLISLMDQSGIGTDATMHDHIKKLLDRCYAVKDANTRFSPTKLGEALVMGYDIMGYELWKPYLRSMMERDMKAVSDGTKTKVEVLEASLCQMRECFLDAKMHKEKLLEAMELFFERNAIWLPNALVEASVLDEACSTCGPGTVHLIHLKFKQGEIPPQYDTEYAGCVGGCDVILRELIEICGTGGGGQSANIRGLNNGGQNNARQAENRNSAQSPMSNIPTQRGGGGQSANSRGLNNGGQTNARQAGNHNSTQGRMSNLPTRRGLASRSRVLNNSLQGSVRKDETWNTSQGQRSFSHNQTDVVACHCEEVCSLLTAQTESNRGRRFYRCAKNNCNFFLWEVQSETSENTSRVNGNAVNATNTTRGSTQARDGGCGGSSRRGERANKRGRGRQNTQGSGSFVRATGETSIINGNCFVCGETSHWANNCPNRM